MDTLPKSGSIEITIVYRGKQIKGQIKLELNHGGIKLECYVRVFISEMSLVNVTVSLRPRKLHAVATPFLG